LSLARPWRFSTSCLWLRDMEGRAMRNCCGVHGPRYARELCPAKSSQLRKKNSPFKYVFHLEHQKYVQNHRNKELEDISTVSPPRCRWFPETKRTFSSSWVIKLLCFQDKNADCSTAASSQHERRWYAFDSPVLSRLRPLTDN
jgi:hypothetical protein